MRLGRLTLAIGAIAIVLLLAWLAAGPAIAYLLERRLHRAGYDGAAVSGASIAFPAAVHLERLRIAPGDAFVLEDVSARLGHGGVAALTIGRLHVRAELGADGEWRVPGREAGAGPPRDPFAHVPGQGIRIAAAEIRLDTPVTDVSLGLSDVRLRRQGPSVVAVGAYVAEAAGLTLEGAATVERASNGATQARIDIGGGSIDLGAVEAAPLTGAAAASLPAGGPLALRLDLAAAEAGVGGTRIGPVALEADWREGAVEFGVSAGASDGTGVDLEGRAVLAGRARSVELSGRGVAAQPDRGELALEADLAIEMREGLALAGPARITGRAVAVPGLFGQGAFDLAGRVEADAERLRLTATEDWSARLTPDAALLPSAVRRPAGLEIAATLASGAPSPAALQLAWGGRTARLRADVRAAAGRDHGRAAADVTVSFAAAGSSPEVVVELASGFVELPGAGLALGALSGTAALRGGRLASAALSVGAIESLAAPAWWTPLSLEATAERDGAALSFEALVSDALGALVLEASGAQDGETGSSSLTLHPVRFIPGATEIGDLSPLLARHMTDVSGTLAFDGEIAWSPAGVQSAGELRADELGATVSEIVVSGVSTAPAFGALWPLATLPAQTAEIVRLDVGVPLANGNAVYDLDAGGRLAIRRLAFDLAGGRLYAEPFIVDSVGAPDIGLVLRAEGVDLSQVLELSRIEGLQGSGTLSGRVPVRITGAGVRLDEGVLAAETDGVLRYTPENPPAFLRGDDLRSRMLREALTNFQYDELSMALSGASGEGGQQTLRFSAAGANPDFLEGHPIELNFNFQGPLLGAMRSAVDVRSAAEIEELYEQQETENAESIR